MSYFDAVIRSSGMPVARSGEMSSDRSAGLPVGVPASDVSGEGIEAAGIEVDVQTTAPAPRDSARRQAVESIPVQGTTKAQAHVDTAPPSAERMHDRQTAPITRPSEPDTSDLGQTMIRAAMQWVAADVQHERAVPSQTPLSPARNEVDQHVRAAQPLRDSHVELPSQRISAPQRSETTSVTAPPLATTAPTPVHASLVADAAKSSMPPAPVRAEAVRDEIVEVSIGAIHVRLDAPAAQTVTGPLSASPPSRNTLPRPARSALSRRALRRI